MEKVAFRHPELLSNLVDPAKESVYVSLKGASNITEQTLTPLSGSGTNTLNFSIIPPATNVILDSVVMLNMQIALTATQPATGTTNNTLIFGHACLESFPINKMIQNISVKINNVQVSNQPYDQMSLLERTLPANWRQKYGNLFPCQVNTVANNPTYYGIATTKVCQSPFATDNMESPTEVVPSRVNFPFTEDALGSTKGYLGAVAVSTATRYYNVTEPLHVPIFSLAKASGISNINRIDITVQFLSDAVNAVVCNPVLSGAAAANYMPYPWWLTGKSSYQNMLGSVCADTAGTPLYRIPNVLTMVRSSEQLFLRYLTPSVQIPEVLKFPIHSFQCYPYSYNQAVGAGATVNITGQMIKTSIVPEKIYIVVRQQLTDTSATGKTVYRCDALYPISNVNLLVNNQAGVLSTATQQQLYQMSQRNGLNTSWVDFNTNGCVVIIEVGKDIAGLPNSTQQFCLLPRITVTNTDVSYVDGTTAAARTNFELDVYFLNGQELTLTPQGGVLKAGIDTSAMQEALLQPASEFPDHAEIGLHGGSFSSFFRNVGNFIKNGAETAWNKVIKPVGSELLGDVLHKAPGMLLHAAMGAGEDDAGGRQMGGRSNLGGSVRSARSQYSMNSHQTGTTHHTRNKQLLL